MLKIKKLTKISYIRKFLMGNSIFNVLSRRNAVCRREEFIMCYTNDTSS